MILEANFKEVNHAINADFGTVAVVGGGGSYDQGYADGQQAQENAFWDTHQQNGTRTDYQGAFAGVGWTNEFFKPKYDMKPSAATYMFRKTGISGDLVEILNNQGVTLDFSNCTNIVEFFSNAPNITRVGVVDIRKAGGNNANAFAYCGATTIDKVIIDETTPFNYFPGVMYDLKEIRFEGTIGKTGMNLKDSKKLSKASIESVINALSTTTSGMSITFSKKAVDNAWAGDGESTGSNTSAWNELVESRPNWTINLV